MGLTRKQLAERDKRDTEKAREYWAHPKIRAANMERSKKRQERIIATGMLLDANWSQSRQLFVKSYQDKLGIWHQTFFNEDGSPCTMDGYIV